jgi:uroporphyrinogen-III decarboxylase
VRDYCKNVIEVAGKGGGYILSTGAGLQGAKPENLKALIDAGREFGVYN